jgi:putative chitinase
MFKFLKKFFAKPQITINHDVSELKISSPKFSAVKFEQRKDFTIEAFLIIMPKLKPELVVVYHPLIVAAMNEFNINTPVRKAAFLAQLAHESFQLKYMEEIASGAAYEGRKDLGNVNPGDGVKYKGRGPIQLTGRANYAKYGKLLNLDLENQPSLAADPAVGFKIAALFWSLNGLNELADINTIDAFRKITRKINGGYNGFDDRVKYWNRAKLVLGVT